MSIPLPQGTVHRRPSRPAVPALLLAAILSLTACATSGPSPTSTEPDTGSSSAPGAEPAGPVRIRIPAIGVDAEIVGVGLEPDGAMEVPEFGLAGWYEPGPLPGEAGPAVVVAHVDSKAGPDVFARLSTLSPGDRIEVLDQRGTVRNWAVEGLEQVPKDRLPTERIWGDTPEPTLRLVTCGGSFDRSTGHYRDNVIAYAGPQG